MAQEEVNTIASERALNNTAVADLTKWSGSSAQSQNASKCIQVILIKSWIMVLLNGFNQLFGLFNRLF